MSPAGSRTASADLQRAGVAEFDTIVGDRECDDHVVELGNTVVVSHHRRSAGHGLIRRPMGALINHPAVGRRRTGPLRQPQRRDQWSGQSAMTTGDQNVAVDEHRGGHRGRRARKATFECPRKVGQLVRRRATPAGTSGLNTGAQQVRHHAGHVPSPPLQVTAPHEEGDLHAGRVPRSRSSLQVVTGCRIGLPASCIL